MVCSCNFCKCCDCQVPYKKIMLVLSMIITCIISVNVILKGMDDEIGAFQYLSLFYLIPSNLLLIKPLIHHCCVQIQQYEVNVLVFISTLFILFGQCVFLRFYARISFFTGIISDILNLISVWYNYVSYQDNFQDIESDEIESAKNNVKKTDVTYQKLPV